MDPHIALGSKSDHSQVEKVFPHVLVFFNFVNPRSSRYFTFLREFSIVLDARLSFSRTGRAQQRPALMR